VREAYDGDEAEIKAEEDKGCLPCYFADHHWGELHDGVVKDPGMRLATGMRKKPKATYQFEHVLKSSVSVLIRMGVISAGYSHMTPNHPIANVVSYTNMNTVAAMAGLRLESVACDKEAPMTSSEIARPPAPNIMRLRRPKRPTNDEESETGRDEVLGAEPGGHEA
jgi:hypothetical protein